MKTVLLSSMAVLTLLALPAAAAAQAHQDYSGKWALSQSKSTPGAAGNGASISFASELIITQSASELKAEMHFPRIEQPQIVVFTLDGSEVTFPVSEGVVEKATALWQGDKLMITAHRVVSTPFGEFVTDTKETWNRTENLLTIQKTQMSAGVTDSQTAVFDRQP
jgi:hypothetical protein